MKLQNKVGFTLIELLVVVLIIGILATIALPQYTKAVERSRVSAATQWLGDAATAQSIYYMEHGSFANVNTLNANGDISIPTRVESWGAPIVDTATTGQVSMALARDGGMYNGSQLIITVHDDGEIEKSCSSTNSEFASIVQSAGYAGTGATATCGGTALTAAGGSEGSEG